MLGVVPRYHWSISKGHLPKIGFVAESPGAFGFIDPALVIQACHIIPVFAEGCIDSLLWHGPSLTQANEDVDDYIAYYVNM